MNDIVHKMMQNELRDAGIDPDDEDALLSAAEATHNTHLIWEITIMLQQIGTRKSVAFLKQLMHYPKTDIKITSFHALASILGADGQDFYVETLDNPKYPEKFSAIQAIRDHCDARAASSVLKRMKRIFSRPRKAVYYNGTMTEVTTCLEYLQRVDATEGVEALELIRKKVAALEPKETEWMQENIPGIV